MPTVALKRACLCLHYLHITAVQLMHNDNGAWEGAESRGGAGREGKRSRGSVRMEIYLAVLVVALGSHTAPRGGCGGLQEGPVQLVCCRLTLHNTPKYGINNSALSAMASTA